MNIITVDELFSKRYLAIHPSKVVASGTRRKKLMCSCKDAPLDVSCMPTISTLLLILTLSLVLDTLRLMRASRFDEDR